MGIIVTIFMIQCPFLRKLFKYLADFELDESICWVVDDLADLFNHVDIHAVQEEFGKTQDDPIIHFYETFLAEYDPALRKSRGVWYTPSPAVKFIVQAVDDILKQDFKLREGLADASKTENDFHRVQILDPATGTGTFLVEVVQNIYRRYKRQQGVWQSYAAEHLIPRLNGFEILMAPYSMAHLKLDMVLQQTGYRHSDNQRLRIYLTNSLDKTRPKTEMLPFAQWLSDEANDANHIKRNVPVMVVMGNPPYSGVSQNKEMMNDLIEDYKYVDGVHFNERKHWLQDDYVKFIRLGQQFLERENGEGILAYINNHGFLDNPTFRGMRWHLLKTFDKIYILDLHGNSKKREVCPGGSKDENVFDIQQGVSINIFVKTGRKAKNALAKLYHFDLYGRRAVKYGFLLGNTLKSIPWQQIENKAPFFFFVPKSEDNKDEYDKGFAINDLFKTNVTGIVTMGDRFIIDEDKKVLKGRIEKLINKGFDEEELNEKFSLGKNYSKWIMENIPFINWEPSKLKRIDYRPFDKRWTYYEKNLIWRRRENVMQHFWRGDNVGLVTCRQSATNSWELVNITKNIVDDSFVSNRTKERGYVFPLYLYPDDNDLLDDKKRKPNLNETIINDIAQGLGLRFTDEKENSRKTFAPIDVLDYIYAVLHSPTYRERYKEFLKIDFPRVPYPEDVKTFWKLVKLGGKLRQLHLMEGVEPHSNMANFPVAGSNEVEKLHYAPAPKGKGGGRVDINDTQYFDRVPSEAWEFYIGGYQPAQKWLKDRKGRQLTYDDIRHYQQIIGVLNETGQVMLEIDEVMG